MGSEGRSTWSITNVSTCPLADSSFSLGSSSAEGIEGLGSDASDCADAPPKAGLCSHCQPTWSGRFRRRHVFAFSQRELSHYVTTVRAKEGTLNQLTDTLGRIKGMTFWDHTGLRGKYDFAISFSQDLDADPQTEIPSLSTALRESLGLTMQKQRARLKP
jgi:uncharacterized protein (TIGR03435 family)